MREHFDRIVFKVEADLDVPTYDDKVVQGKLKATSVGSHGTWESLSVILGLFSSVARLVTEFCVLVKVIGGQQDGISFAVVHLSQELSRFFLASDRSPSRTAG